MDFSYQAIDASGRRSAGLLTAAGRLEALGALRAKGLTPLNLSERVEAEPRPVGRRPRASDALAFTQQMATLINAGLQIDRALAIIGDLAREQAIGPTVTAIRRDVQEGAAFSAALARHPRLFNRVYVNMVRAGETGGVLPVVLRRLAETTEEERELRSFVISAVLYPGVVACVSLIAFLALMLFVVPRFQDIFLQLNQNLPPLTHFVMALSRLLRARGIWILGALAAAAVFLIAGARTTGGRALIDRTILRLPRIGDLYLKLATARVSRTLAMLVGAGVSVLQAFAVVKETVGNRIIARGLERAGQEIKEGGGIARRLAAQKVLPPLAVQMIAVGEETGELPAMLDQIARDYDREVRRSIRGLLSLLEPALILCLTAMTLLIAVSILLPMLGMSASVSEM